MIKGLIRFIVRSAKEYFEPTVWFYHIFGGIKEVIKSFLMMLFMNSEDYKELQTAKVEQERDELFELAINPK